MAQPKTRTATEAESPGEGLVRVEVGTRTLPTTKRELPEQIGDFEHRPVQNFRTAAWARRFYPAGSDDAHVREVYMATCASGGWQITRGVVTSEHHPEKPKMLVEDILLCETVRGGFESFEATMQVAEQVMGAASRRSVEYPADVPERVADVFEAAAQEVDHA